MNRSNPTSATEDRESTAAEQTRPRVRDAHFVLGTDADGTIHHRSLVDGAVYWIDQDGAVVRRLVVEDGRVDEYVEAVAAERGWDDIRYGERGWAQSWARIAEEQERARKEVSA